MTYAYRNSNYTHHRFSRLAGPNDRPKFTKMKITYCPHCKSAPDTVRQHSHWACGVMYRDKNWRTKECHKREVALLKERIKELEEATK
jgi:transposase-like protein